MVKRERCINSELSKQVKNSANIVKNGVEVKRGIPVIKEKKGTIKDINNETVGVSIGSTLNMGDYQSLKVEVWYSSSVNKDETVEDAFNRVTNIVSETLVKVVNDYKE